MITTLLLTVVLGGGDVAQFGYAYPDQQSCNNALTQTSYETTGNYSVELNCAPDGGPSPAISYKRTTYQVLVMGMQKSTRVVTMDPDRVKNNLPDEASCTFYIREANKRFKGLGGRDYVSICLPEASQ